MKDTKKNKRKGYRINKNILIEDFKSIYFFIPKNGCTSFKTAIFNFVGDKDFEDTVHKFDFPFVQFEQLNTDYTDYFKFAFVRNPWNRIVSCFKGKIRSSDVTNKNFKNGVARIFLKYGQLFYGDMPFDKFVDAVCSIPHSKANPHFISQLYRLTDNAGNILPNYIGRLENVKTAIDEIYQTTGLSLSNMGHENKSRISDSYIKYYDEHLKEKVREKFAGDIEIFGYEFEPDQSLEPIGFVDEAFRNRLAKSKYIDPIIREKINS